MTRHSDVLRRVAANEENVADQLSATGDVEDGAAAWLAVKNAAALRALAQRIEQLQEADVRFLADGPVRDAVSAIRAGFPAGGVGEPGEPREQTLPNQR